MQVNLINQSELEALCLTTPALNELKAQVINQLNGIEDPLRRYATARCLKNVFEEAASDTNASAVDYCLTHNIGLDNVMFKQDGLSFILDYECEYNWDNNDFDEDGNSLGYKKAFREFQSAKKLLAKWTGKLARAKKDIEVTHPKMAPVNPRWTMKFLIKET